MNRPRHRSVGAVAPAGERFQELVDAWLGTLVSSNTREAYRRDLHLYSVWLHAASRPAALATSDDILDFRARCEADGSGAATVNRRIAAVSSFYRYAASEWSGPNPVDGVERRPGRTSGAPGRLTAAEAASVWDAAVGLGPKTAVIIGLVLLDGLKTNQLLQLDLEQVEISTARVVIELDRRNVMDRVVLDPRTAAVVRAHLAGRRHGPLLFGDSPTRDPARLTRFGVDYLVKRAGIRAGLSAPLTVNRLRSTRSGVG